MGPHLRRALDPRPGLDRPSRRPDDVVGQPAGVVGQDRTHREVGRRADHDAVGDRLHLEDVPGLAVGRGSADRQALALPDRVRVRAVVRADHATGGVDDVARPRTEMVSQEAVGVAVGHEADVVGVRLRGDRQAPPRGLGPDLVLGRGVPEREHRPGQPIGPDDRQDVRLVLGEVGRPVQLARAVGPQLDPGVVAGAHGVEPQRERLVEQCLELDVLVAAHARVGRAAGLVLGEEVGDHRLLEALRQVPHVVRDAEHVRRATRVARVLDRAAAPRPGPELLAVARQRHVHPDDVVPRLDRARGRHGGVDAARERGEDLHRDPPDDVEASPADRARSTTPGSTATSASTSAPVEVRPRLNRSAPRASDSLTPIASSTWLG